MGIWTRLLAPILILSASCGFSGKEGSASGEQAVRLQPNGASAGLPPGKGSPTLSVDRIGDVIDPLTKPPVTIPLSGDIVTSGFAVDVHALNLASGVDVAIDSLPFTAHYHIERADVATYFKTPAYKESGFQFTVPARYFGKGSHTLAVRVIANDGKSYLEGPPLTVNIQ
jgi:hypothetical protein